MYAGTARIDITPQEPVYMDGMLRDHRSEGIHDPLYVKALVLSETRRPEDAVAFVSVDVCALHTKATDPARESGARLSGIPLERIVVHATHTHSGPATLGFFNPREEAVVARIVEAVGQGLAECVAGLREVKLAEAAGEEDTISHYRRLLATDGHVVMNWEPYPAEQIVGPLGDVDPLVVALHVVAADSGETVAIMFNHTGHPNVLSGDNYLLSAEYPGRAEQLLEQRHGGLALFFNGALGTMDIDGLRDRDWDGMERIGQALAGAVSETVAAATPQAAVPLRVARDQYTVPARQITDQEFAWAQEILKRTGGKVEFLADGVGDDYLAVLYAKLREVQDQPVELKVICIGVGDTAFLTFPGELYTEIGMHIKERSPFARTCILGLANGHIGYVPTAVAISEGGYAEDTRRVDAAAEGIIVQRSLALLRKVHALQTEPMGVNA